MVRPLHHGQEAVVRPPQHEPKGEVRPGGGGGRVGMAFRVFLDLLRHQAEENGKLLLEKHQKPPKMVANSEKYPKNWEIDPKIFSAAAKKTHFFFAPRTRTFWGQTPKCGKCGAHNRMCGRPHRSLGSWCKNKKKEKMCASATFHHLFYDLY